MMLARTDTVRMGRGAGIALAVMLIGLLAAAPVAAAGPTDHARVTRGDVMAAFQARTTGGFVNLLNGRHTSAPLVGLDRGRISPFRYGATYCTSDWHYIAVTFEAPGPHAAAAAFFAATSYELDVDGAPIGPLMRTSVKAFVDRTNRGSFGQSSGALVPPGSLSAGEHWLRTFADTPLGPIELFTPFEIDPTC